MLILFDGLVKDLNFNHDKYDVDIQKRDMIKCKSLAWTVKCHIILKLLFTKNKK